MKYSLRLVYEWKREGITILQLHVSYQRRRISRHIFLNRSMSLKILGVRLTSLCFWSFHRHSYCQTYVNASTNSYPLPENSCGRKGTRKIRLLDHGVSSVTSTGLFRTTLNVRSFSLSFLSKYFLSSFLSFSLSFSPSFWFFPLPFSFGLVFYLWLPLFSFFFSFNYVSLFQLYLLSFTSE